MTSSPYSSQSTKVTQSGTEVRGSIRDSKIEVNQVVRKDTSVANQSGVCSLELVDTEVAVSQSARGTHLPITGDAIEVSGTHTTALRSFCAHG